MRTISILPDPSIRVLQPIPFTVDGEYVAVVSNTSISASGESLEEAVENLADIIALTFRLYCRKENNLSQRLRQQLQILRRYLQL